MSQKPGPPARTNFELLGNLSGGGPYAPPPMVNRVKSGGKIFHYFFDLKRLRNILQLLSSRLSSLFFRDGSQKQTISVMSGGGPCVILTNSCTVGSIMINVVSISAY